MIFYLSLLLSFYCTLGEEFISPNSSDAYTWRSGYPQSCECIETDVKSSDCKLFKCKCVCDITAGQCDYSCCCDPDCSDDEISRFKSQNACDEEGYTPTTEMLCYSSDELAKVNPRTPLGGESSARTGLDELLCIEKNNKAYKGEYYEEAKHKAASVFSKSEGSKSYDYISSPTTSTLQDGYYDQNDTIQSYNFASGQYVRAPLSYLAVAKPNFGGYCNDNSYVTFANDVTKTSCTRIFGNRDLGLTAFSSQCASGAVSTAYTYQNVFVAATPPDDSTNIPSAYVPVTLTKVSYYDSSDGSLVDVTSSWLAESCQTFAASGPVTSNCSFGNANASSTTCFNAIKSVDYVIYHQQDSTSTIHSVNVTIVITDVEYNEVTSQSQSFLQSFSASFVNTPSDSSISQKNGNIIRRSRSGNPGYLMGSVIQHGYAHDGVVNLTSGFEIQSSLTKDNSQFQSYFGKSLCPSESVSNLATTFVKFGYDSVSGCVMKLNRNELASLCCEGASLCSESYNNSVYSTGSGVPIYLQPQTGMIGMYGNADPLDVNQWFTITNNAPSVSSRKWTSSTSTCSSMITGINYRFLVAYTGEKANPQNKIISAQTDYSLSDIKMNVPASDTITTMEVPLDVTVTFVFTNEEKLKGYNPPPQPSLLTVPYDVFYPFQISGASCSSSAATLVFSAVTTFLVIMFQMM